jgi:hypothetical protein
VAKLTGTSLVLKTDAKVDGGVFGLSGAFTGNGAQGVTFDRSNGSKTEIEVSGTATSLVFGTSSTKGQLSLTDVGIGNLTATVTSGVRLTLGPGGHITTIGATGKVTSASDILAGSNARFSTTGTFILSIGASNATTLTIGTSTLLTISSPGILSIPSGGSLRFYGTTSSALKLLPGASLTAAADAAIRHITATGTSNVILTVGTSNTSGFGAKAKLVKTGTVYMVTGTTAPNTTLSGTTIGPIGGMRWYIEDEIVAGIRGTSTTGAGTLKAGTGTYIKLSGTSPFWPAPTP